jgi:hypothetical protein
MPSRRQLRSHIKTPGDTMSRFATIAGAAAATLALSLQAQASVSSHQSLSSFQAGTASQVSADWVDFETPATSLATAAFTVQGSVGAGTPLRVSTNGLWTSSGTHFLGDTDAGNFDQLNSGDSITFSFAKAVGGFGLYVVTVSDTQAGDLTLSTGVHSVSNGDPSTAITDGQGSYAYFLGLSAGTPAEGFTSFTLSSGTAGFYVFSVDDVRYSSLSAVPEPQGLALALAGLGALCLGARRRSC